jgi:hypothetical protein
MIMRNGWHVEEELRSWLALPHMNAMDAMDWLRIYHEGYA